MILAHEVRQVAKKSIRDRIINEIYSSARNGNFAIRISVDKSISKEFVEELIDKGYQVDSFTGNTIEISWRLK